MTNRARAYEAYEKIADWFDLVRMRDLSYEKPHLEMVTTNIQANGKVLDIGCGMGEPITKYFADAGFEVVGIDGCASMIEKARMHVPNAKFYVLDMRRLAFNEKFDAIILWHSLFHLSAEDQQAMFPIFKQHLNKEGLLLFTSGCSGEVEENDSEQNPYHYSLVPDRYRTLLVSHDFEILAHKVDQYYRSNSTIWVARYKGNYII